MHATACELVWLVGGHNCLGEELPTRLWQGLGTLVWVGCSKPSVWETGPCRTLKAFFSWRDTAHLPSLAFGNIRILRTKQPWPLQVRSGFDSGLVPAFGGSWRTYPRPSFVSWPWLMPGGFHSSVPSPTRPARRPHLGAAQGYMCCQTAPTDWPSTWVGWRAWTGAGIFPGCQPKAGLKATDINHIFNMHPSCRCSANSPSPAVCRSLCKGEWWPSCPSWEGTSLLLQFSASQFAFLVFALGRAGMRQAKLGPWADATWLQTGFKIF